MIVSPTTVKASRLGDVEDGSLIVVSFGNTKYYALKGTWKRRNNQESDTIYVIPIGPYYPDDNPFPTAMVLKDDYNVLDLGSAKFVLPVNDLTTIGFPAGNEACCGIIVAEAGRFLRIAMTPVNEPIRYVFLNLDSGEVEENAPARPREMFTRWEVLLPSSEGDVHITRYPPGE